MLPPHCFVSFMLLLIDIGNTNITTGFCKGGIQDVIQQSTVMGKQYTEGLKVYIARHRMEKPDSAIICSVVPRVTPLLVEKLKKNFKIVPLKVNYKMQTGLKFCIKQPGKLGADRIANAVGAHNLYKGHLIVIDFGTATTFCVVSSKGEVKGGAIMPGLGISLVALSEKTAQLPRIRLNVPKKMLGGDTQNNILSGIILGHAGAVERIIRDLKRELVRDKQVRDKSAVKVIATGGFAHLMAAYVTQIKEINLHLTLEGLRLLHGMNV
jgi:type III pantothenate kinase